MFILTPPNTQDAQLAQWLQELYNYLANNIYYYSDGSVSNPPTKAELTSLFGEPNRVGAQFSALLNNGGASSDVYLIASDGTDWYYTALTKAL